MKVSKDNFGQDALCAMAVGVQETACDIRRQRDVASFTLFVNPTCLLSRAYA